MDCFHGIFIRCVDAVSKGMGEVGVEQLVEGIWRRRTQQPGKAGILPIKSHLLFGRTTLVILAGLPIGEWNRSVSQAECHRE
jgi:hypothetical protein